ncbi:sodium:proton antiporter [Rathayibacter sp. AY1E3]|jgi:hypothetical protein|uniref:DUF6328 family protein n=1 Tax=unclassified Rathayibacter TaxID=2609250 RepID=UPI000CE7F220|nr:MULTISPECIES: DUF6328 family protein [unclassified Rathayibacter]PPF35145.1 sodium:proton antiporter [Rathayibacter sp. AY1A3]PPF70682.1 sodium:proton antiporter [Rathayibacter sp. AY1E6]PPG28358.1 sodium:proton antiporter [Rathayibacter sp. AY2B9]PPH34871.1 sodium:proton antiporter [Rathayibacter sp. AY1E3]
MSDRPVDPSAPDSGRDETVEERSDRNWNEILQELRVVQTGTQILGGFLLTLCFQQRFADLAPPDVALYLVLVLLAACVTILALAPVIAHRLLFQRRRKAELVRFGNRVVTVCLAAGSLLFVGVVGFVFDVVLGGPAGLWAGGGVLLLLAVVWATAPILLRRR